MKFKQKEVEKIYKKLGKDLKSKTASELKTEYLGKKGAISALLQKIGSKEPKDRAIFGKEVNILKTYFEEELTKAKLATRETLGSSARIDPTAPFDVNTPEENRPKLLTADSGSVHPLMRSLEEFVDIFSRMGFDIMESRQLDDDYHMFESLNFPKGHPARDMYDTFRTEENLIPPAHTSTMQNRALKTFGPPPVRVVLPGFCYRNEATDASHEHTFFQIEGIYVDRGISVGDMIGTIKSYLEAFLDTTLDIKIQPAFFPFTEPDVEFTISCPFCQKAGCSVCGHSGWIELMGCGMIHPNVLKEAGINHKEFGGFAWGFGLDRITMIKHGIEDIRNLHGGDLNFLRQFS